MHIWTGRTIKTLNLDMWNDVGRFKCCFMPLQNPMIEVLGGPCSRSLLSKWPLKCEAACQALESKP